MTIAFFMLMSILNGEKERGLRMWFLWILIPVVVFWWLLGIRIVRPTHRGLVERLGKDPRVAQTGGHRVIPFRTAPG